jgi:hypothetical protein
MYCADNWPKGILIRPYVDRKRNNRKIGAHRPRRRNPPEIKRYRNYDEKDTKRSKILRDEYYRPNTPRYYHNEEEYYECNDYNNGHYWSSGYQY